LHQRGKQLQGSQQEQALAELDREIENVRAAWRWAVAQRRLPELKQSLRGLGLYYHSRGWFVEGEAAMRLAVASLSNQDNGVPDQATAVVLGGAMMLQGLYCGLLGRYEQSSCLLEKSLVLLRPTDATWETVMALSWLGLATISQGRYQAARAYVQQGLSLAQVSQDRWLVGIAFTCLGLCARWHDYAEAAQYFQAGLTIFRELGDWHRMAAPLLYLGEAIRMSGNLTDAKLHLDSSLSFARENRIRQLEAWTLWNLGEVAYALEEYSEAQHCFVEGLAVARQVGDNHVIVSCLARLGSVALRQGHDSEAQAYFHTALQRAVETQAWPHVAGLLVRRAEMLSRRDQAAQVRAVEWLALAVRHPAITQESRTCAERLLDLLRTALPPEAFAAAWERGLTHTMENISIRNIQCGSK
jgi:tetratricopeptide (TPR) repeat protein